ncbi:MAG: hypothetical protein AAFN06_10490 [Pseudomonadota bacterium]
MELRIETLNRASLQGTGLSRVLPDDFEQSGNGSFDPDTLWYDAVWTGRSLALICPTLDVIEDPLLEAGIYLDGVRARRVRIERQVGHDVLWIRSRKRPDRVETTLGGVTIGSAISDRRADAVFEGRNTAVTLSNNNDLVWIEDWARYHVEKHGLEAVLFFDNGSDLYDLDTLADALKRGGVAATMIVSVPHPYGVHGYSDGQPYWRALNLQIAILNVARLRFLRRARAVLQCDVDELFWCANGSIFDATRRHPLGFLHIGGQWCYPDDGAPSANGATMRHRDHYLRNSETEHCSAKFCIRPRGPLFFASWRVHSLSGLRQPTVIKPTRAMGFWHFRQVSTAWRDTKRMAFPEGLVEDPELIQAMQLFQPEPDR